MAKTLTDMVPSHRSSQAYIVTTAFFSLFAESASPMLVGTLYNDAIKSYAVGFVLLICLALTGAIIVSFLPKTSGYKGD